MLRSAIVPWRSVVFMSRSCWEPLTRVYHSLLTTVSLPASRNVKPLPA